MCFLLSLIAPFSKQQHSLLQHEFGDVVTNTASSYARRLPWLSQKPTKLAVEPCTKVLGRRTDFQA